MRRHGLRAFRRDQAINAVFILLRRASAWALQPCALGFGLEFCPGVLHPDEYCAPCRARRLVRFHAATNWQRRPVDAYGL